jgi:EmrB/QacA subfamily drug resistance transporter
MPGQMHVPQTAEEADPRRWIALAILLLAGFMNLMDVSIVNVALPSMQKNLGADPSHIEWVVAAYVLAFALGLLPFGRLGDIVGRKKMFLIGVSLFTVGSALCGIAPNIETLIAARVVQGFASAVMTPQVLAIAQVTFPPKEKGLAFSLFGLSAGLASVCGPVIGGALIAGNFAGLDWRPIFLVNIPFGVLAVVAGAILIPNVPPHPGIKNDYAGIGLFGAAIVLLIYPLIEGRAYGWPLWSFAMIAVSVLFMIAFYFWERQQHNRGRPELLPLGLLQNRNFLLGALMTILFFSGIPGFFLILAVFLQSGFGLSPLESGLTTVPFSLGVLLASLISGRLGSRFLQQRFAAGAILLAIGMTLLRISFSQISGTISPWAFALPLLISGVGLGTGIAGLFQTVLSTVPPRDAGSGAGALQAFQQAGGALGVAIVGEIFFTWLSNAQVLGATSKTAAFVNAASSAMLYEIAIYVVVAAMIPFLKPLPRTEQTYGKEPPEPVIAEL